MKRRVMLPIAGAVLAAGFAVGCGGDAAGTVGDSAQADTSTPVTAPAPAAPAVLRSGPLQKGEVIRPSTRTPRAFERALDAKRPIVVAMLMRGIADEDYVAAAIERARASTVGNGATFLVYDVNTQQGFGDLPLLLGMTGTPSVVVLDGTGAVVNSWAGVVDEQIIQQALSEARDAAPAG